MEAPAIWVLLSDKGGDNAQALNLATATGLAFSTRKMAVKPAYAARKPKVGASIEHLDLPNSDALQPPWPRIVIAVGRRPSNVALHIKRQSPGFTRIVLIGAPKGRKDAFDLIIAPTHYTVADSHNVLRIGLPLLEIPPAKLREAAEAWTPRFANFIRPMTALLVGGSTGAASLGAAEAARIARHALAHANGGTLCTLTSRRTPDAATQAIATVLPPEAPLHRWPAADSGIALGLFACADRFIVTGDSISMIVEAVSTGKPVAIAAWRDGRLGARLRRAFTSPVRDVELLHERLFAAGAAVPLGRPFVDPPPLTSDLPRAAEAVRRLAASG